MTRRELDILAWLADLGLHEHGPVFIENGVDASLLSELTNEDLKDLGVTRLRDRKLLLKAIAKLGQEPASARAPVVERRQLTVMFCDLVGSTELSARHDPEDMREIISAFQAKCRTAIRQYDGFIARYMGDGILTYFGYPQAHEDSAERAVRAGLAIADSMPESKAVLGALYGDGLAVRVGVATGPVVIGDIVGEGVADEAAVVGETPNLAARLQGSAAPNQVVVADGTRRSLGALFDYEDLGEHRLKGIARPLRLWRVARALDVDSRFSAIRLGRSAPLIGRQAEYERLLSAWGASKGESGTAITIGGEAGIGKSRLCEALGQQVAAERHRVIRVQCSPFHSGTTLYPFIEQLRSAAGIERDDASDVSLAKLKRLLSESLVDGILAADLIAPLLSIESSGSSLVDIGPARRKLLTLEALAQRLGSIDRASPLVLIVEDAHWADPTTLELLDMLVARLDEIPMLIVITHRPEFESPWAGHANVESMSLKPLANDEAANLVQQLASGVALPDGALERILSKTDGVPLFVEEMTKMLMERLRQSGEGAVASSGDSLTNIPTTIHDLLLERLDQLGSAKRIAQQAACFGRTFTFARLAAITDVDTGQLELLIDRLKESGLVIAGEGHSYSFNHALVQDAAYDSLLRASRVDLHSRIAKSLESELAELEPEVLAHHFGRALMYEKEVEYWQRAGLKAMDASASIEAASHFRRAIDRLDKLSDDQRASKELELHVQIAVPLTLTLGWASEEVHAAYERAYQLCQEDNDSPLLFPVLAGMFRYLLVTGNHHGAQEIAERDLERAERSKDDDVVVEFILHSGVVRFYTGRPADAVPWLERCISVYDPARHGDHIESYGACPATIGAAHLANSLAILGRPDEAFDANRRSAQFADNVRHVFSQVWAMSNQAMNHILYEEPEQVAELARRMIAISSEQQFLNWLAQARVWLGWSEVYMDNADSGLVNVLEGIEIWDKTGAKLMRPFYYYLLADCYERRGEHVNAQSAVDRAFQCIANTGERWTAPISDLLSAEVSLRLGQTSADAAYERFREIADAARQKNEWLWAFKAERQLLESPAGGSDPEVKRRLKSTLGKFSSITTYPMLHRADVNASS